MEISVIVCTHNPRPNYLRRVLDALKAQTLPKDQWELLLVDNASKELLASTCDLSWHPQARHVREDELGHTQARLRGIRESRAEVLVFVDDDNVLADDYLAVALELVQSHPWVGALGGTTKGEFETEPESWWQGRLENLAVLEVKTEVWARLSGISGVGLFMPCGAGIVIRKSAAARWAEAVTNDPLRQALGRKGTSLTGHDDVDMTLFVCSIGLAIGRFPKLWLTHIIPSMRLERSYFIRMQEGNATSGTLLNFIWDGALPNLNQRPPKISRAERLFQFYKTLRVWLKGGSNVVSFEDELRDATRRGRGRAAQMIQAYLRDQQRVKPSDHND